MKPCSLHIFFSVLIGSEDIAAVYNILYRSLFDRHRDLSLPTSLLINENGEIVKIYRGPVNPDHVQTDFRRIPNALRIEWPERFPSPRAQNI